MLQYNFIIIFLWACMRIFNTDKQLVSGSTVPCSTAPFNAAAGQSVWPKFCALFLFPLLNNVFYAIIIFYDISMAPSSDIRTVHNAYPTLREYY